MVGMWRVAHSNSLKKIPAVRMVRVMIMTKKHGTCHRRQAPTEGRSAEQEREGNATVAKRTCKR